MITGNLKNSLPLQPRAHANSLPKKPPPIMATESTVLQISFSSWKSKTSLNSVIFSCIVGLASENAPGTLGDAPENSLFIILQKLCVLK